MGTHVRHHSTIARLMAAWVTCVFSLGSLWSFVHEATVAHVTCVEHGEQLHVRAADSAVPSAGATGGTTLRSVPGSPPGHDHDPCLAASASRTRMGLARDATQCTPEPAAQRCPARAVTSPRHTQVALYYLAPKASPPSA